MKSILLHVASDKGFQSRLEAAVAAARSYDAHVDLVRVTPYETFLVGDPFGAASVLPVLPEEVRRHQQDDRDSIEARFRTEGISWDWHELDGIPQQRILEQSRLSDLIVLNLPGGAGALADPPASLTGVVAIHARAPVLAVPADSGSVDLLGPALLAWNGSQECAHALRLTLSMLKAASAVHIVTVGDDHPAFPASTASRYLGMHEIISDLHDWPIDGGSVGETLLAAAASLQAQYIVMGAYGRLRFMESLFGGVTRDLLHSSTPLVLAH